MGSTRQQGITERCFLFLSLLETKCRQNHPSPMGYAKIALDSWACPAPATVRPEEPLPLVLSYHWQESD